MLRTLLAASLMLAPAGAHAAERKLGGAEIQTLLADHSFTGSDSGHQSEQIFRASGSTVYSVDNNPSQGFWKVMGDQYCSQWPPHDAWSCYDVTVDGDTVTFISGTGNRYPVMREN